MTTTARLTPPLGAVGQYSLKTPWTTAASMNYRCTALLRVEELVKSGKNIYKTFYEPVGLSEDVCKTDIAAGVVFVSLLGSDGSRIYVPDTYISSYPNQSAVTYSYLVMTIDLGPQPSTVDLTAAMDEVKEVVNKFTGVATTDIAVGLAAAQSNTMMTKEQMIAAEDARRLAIENTIPSEMVIEELQARIAEQDSLIQQLLNPTP